MNYLDSVGKLFIIPWAGLDFFTVARDLHTRSFTEFLCALNFHNSMNINCMQIFEPDWEVSVSELRHGMSHTG